MKEGGGKAALDSGTTFVYFSLKLYNAFKLKFANFCRSGSTNCAKISDFQTCYIHNKKAYPNIQDFFNTFPPIMFTFDDTVMIDWVPSEYFFHDGNSTSYCIGIEPLKDLILGAIFMKNFDILFDQEKKSVGFVQANCDGSGPKDLTTFISQNYR